MDRPDLSVIVACYGQPRMMSVFFDECFTWHSSLKRHIELVVVDDCGTPKQTLPPDMGLWGEQLLRVEKDIPWNQMGARNLGLQEARGRFVLMLDPDCTINWNVMTRLFMRTRHESCKDDVVLLALLRQGKLDHTSPNMWFGPRELFLKVGGYDEDYAGNKGWSDVQLLSTVKGFGVKIWHKDELYAIYHEDKNLIPDHRVDTLDRSVAKNRKLHLKKHAHASKIGWPRFVKEAKGPNVRFPWTRLRAVPSMD